MPVSRVLQIEQDLRKKVALERRLSKEISQVLRKETRSIMESIERTGDIGPIENEALLQKVLERHYGRVHKVFGDQVSKRLSSKAKLSAQELAEASSDLARQAAFRAANQANRIMATTVRNAERALNIALQERTNKLLEGIPVTNRELSRTAGRKLQQLSASRTKAIAAMETNVSAEEAKNKEIEKLIQGRDTSQVQLVKEWLSQGDSRVREIHLEADSQEVPIDQPFIVGGESLMYPGDTSLGASPGNVINCRCSVFYPEDQIEKLRTV